MLISQKSPDEFFHVTFFQFLICFRHQGHSDNGNQLLIIKYKFENNFYFLSGQHLRSHCQKSIDRQSNALFFEYSGVSEFG